MHREKQTHYTDEDVNSWASIIAQHAYARHPPVPSFFMADMFFVSVFLVRLLLTSVSVLGGG